MNKENLLYIDTETTDTQSKDLLQLAILTDNPDIYMNMYFKPIQEISFGAMSIHNITPEDVEDCDTFEQAKLPKEGIDPQYKGDSLKEYLQFLADKYIWVAHNVDFDVEVLEKKVFKYQIKYVH